MRQEAIYLSKSRLRALWMDLPITSKQRLQLSEIAAKASVSLKPSAEVSAKWSPAARHAHHEWPPWESHQFIEAIDAYAESKGGAGGWNDVANNNAARELYRLSGSLVRPENSSGTSFTYGRLQLTADTIDLLLQGSNKVSVPTVLSLENLHGLERGKDGWEITSSLAFHFFREIEHEGFPVTGMFTAERSAKGPIKLLRAAYLIR